VRNRRVLALVRDTLASSTSLSAILRLITERVGRALAIDRTSIWIFDPKGGASRCVERWDNRVARHIADGAMPPLLIDLGLRDQLRRERCLVVRDVTADPRVTPAMRVYFDAKHIRACLYALIQLPGRSVGVLTFALTSDPHDWTSDDQAFARALADLVAHAFLLDGYREALSALDLVADGIYVQDIRGDVIYANRAARALGAFAHDAEVVASQLPGLPDGGREGASEVAWLVNGAEHVLEVWRGARPEGGAITMVSDVTEERHRDRERRSLEARMRQTRKMEAVGRLAGGIAHDFNNLLGAIGAFAAFLLQDLATGTPSRRFAERITEACGQGKALIAQLLAFSRGAPLHTEILDLGEVVAAHWAVLAAAVADTTGLVLDSGGLPLPVRANAGQLCQLLLNLCINASDALGGRPGIVTIRISELGLEDPDRVPFSQRTAAPEIAETVGGTFDSTSIYAAIAVEDRGEGMDQATLDRAFEPFFTTKPWRRGTGLGLAVVHGILEESGGAYLAQSRRGAGTTISVYLPLAETAVAAERCSKKDSLRGRL
jgi:signal transduction histidine kinase